MNNSNVAYVDVHLVKIIKLPMTLHVDNCVKGDYPIYKLSVKHEVIIYATLKEDD